MVIFTPNTVIKSADINTNFADAVDVTKQNNPYIFHAYRSGTQSPTTATWTTLQLNAEEFDLNNDFDTSTYLYTVPADGYYDLKLQVFASNADSTNVIGQICKNPTGTNASGLGGTVLAESRDIYNASSNRVPNLSCFVLLTTGDTIGGCVYVQDTTSPTVSAGAGVSFLSGYMVRGL